MLPTAWIKQLFARSSRRLPLKRRRSARPRLEQLEDRLAPAVVLSYGGTGTALTLTESVSATAHVTISEVSANDLRIDLNGATFDGTSTAAASGLTYQNAGSPAISTFADLNIATLNAITLLTANLTVPGDQLNLGAINDTAGGLGNLSGTSDSINVNGVVDLTHAAAGNGAVTLTAPTALTIAGTGGISSTNGDVTLNANAMSLGGAINDAGKIVTLDQASTTARTIDLGGADSGARLSLTDADLGEVTAGILRIGRKDNTGKVEVTSSISEHSGFNTLSLRSGGPIVGYLAFAGAVSLTVTKLALQGSQVFMGSADVVSQVAGSSNNAIFGFRYSGGLTVGSVDGVSGIHANGGQVQISSGFGGSDKLTVANEIVSTNNTIFLSADQMDLNAPVNAGSSTVTLGTATSSQPVTIGTKPGTSLGLLQSDLSQITAGSPVVIQGGGTFDVGDASNSLSFLTSNISLAGVGSSTLTLNDEGSFIGNYIVTNSEVDPKGTGHIGYANMTTLTLKGGEGSGAFEVLSLGATTTLNLIGGNSFHGNNTFDIGASANSLAGILGSVNITGGGFLDPFEGDQTFSVGVNGATISRTLSGTTLVQVIDQNDATGAFTLTGNTIQRAGDGLITLNRTDFLNVFLNLGSSFTANSTPAGLTTIYGNGNNTNTVQTTAANSVLVIKASATGSTTNITTTGNGSLVFINGSTGADALTVQTTGANSGVELDGGNGENSGNILGAGAGSLTLITVGGGGTNHFNVGSTSLSGIQGNVSFFGKLNLGSDNDDLTLNDQGDTSTRTYTLTSNQVTRTGAAQIYYAGMTTLRLNGSQGNDVYNISSQADIEAPDFEGSVTTGTSLVAGSGNDTFNVPVSIFTGYNFSVDGGGGSNSLIVTDISGSATMHNNVTSSTSGTVTVDYPGEFPNIFQEGPQSSTIGYANIGTVNLVSPTPPPPPTGSAYVTVLFEVTIGRPPSPVELTSFTNYLNGNGPLALANLLEGCPDGLAHTVQRYFQELLGRLPNADEVRTGVNLLQQGTSEVSMLGTLMGMADAFASLDFRQLEVSTDFGRMLGRAPNQDEMNALANNPTLSLTTIRELLEADALFKSFA